MWHRTDSQRFIPTDIKRRFRGASFHDPGRDQAQRRSTVPKVHIDEYGQSQIGQTRRVNQDQFFTMPLGKDQSVVHCFLGVADGIGGAPAGHDASFLAVESLTHFVREESQLLLRPERNDGEIIQTLARGLKRCHGDLQHAVVQRPEFSGMGTTMTAGLVLWPYLYLVHVGDARAYLLHQGELRRLTHDHTYGQELFEAGVLNESTIKTSYMSNVLSNYISGDLPEKDPEVHPDARVELLRPGDTLLFCTDGLTHVLTDEMLTQILTADESAKVICQQLIDRAREGQARDDATALIARFTDTEDLSGGRRKSAEVGW
jgi:serine/threonine protein phosphatase PrpC